MFTEDIARPHLGVVEDRLSQAGMSTNLTLLRLRAQVKTVHYMGRPTAASPATASAAIHRAETAEIINLALSD